MKIGVKIAVLRLVPVMGRRVVVAGFVSFAAGRSPILILRVIEAQLDSLLAALVGKFADGIPFERSAGDDVERVRLGIEHRKSVVML